MKLADTQDSSKISDKFKAGPHYTVFFGSAWIVEKQIHTLPSCHDGETKTRSVFISSTTWNKRLSKIHLSHSWYNYDR